MYQKTCVPGSYASAIGSRLGSILSASDATLWSNGYDGCLRSMRLRVQIPQPECQFDSFTYVTPSTTEAALAVAVLP